MDRLVFRTWVGGSLLMAWATGALVPLGIAVGIGVGMYWLVNSRFSALLNKTYQEKAKEIQRKIKKLDDKKRDAAAREGRKMLDAYAKRQEFEKRWCQEASIFVAVGTAMMPAVGIPALLYMWHSMQSKKPVRAKA